IAQIYFGASQPSTLAADLANALFYASSFDNGYPSSSKDILSTGDLRWSGTMSNGVLNGNVLANGRVTDGAGVATDQTGSGQLYRFVFPSTISSPLVPTDFFQVTPPNSVAQTRVSGLVQNGDTPGTNIGQWPEFQGSNFAVNPIDSTAIVIGSKS